jgi:DNA polymerase-3 subunit alpha
MAFTHLHTHSHYSLLDGLTKLPDMVQIAKKAGMKAIGLTDHGNMHGAIELYKLCKKEGIRPIIGVEAYLAPGSRTDKEGTGNGKRYYHLSLLAKNLQGYKNLMRLVSLANLEGYYYKPRMDKELLREYHEGIVCLSGCMGGELSQTILSRDIAKAEKLIAEYQDIFGKENYFIEIQSHPSVPNDKELRDALVSLGKKLHIPVVATQDSHYPCQEDHEAHHTLLAINTQGDGKEGLEFSKDDFSLIDEKTALEYFKDVPEAVGNTQLVVDLCEDYEIELGTAYFPEYKIESGKSADEELRTLAYAGFAFRNLEQKKEYVDRLEYELGVIKQKGYPTYFLVVGDLLRFARKNGILTNIRGSVAGSLTTYLLGITNVDPLVYKLPFERFLNPERPSLPDIDMDYADNRREEMIAYAKQKYGEDHVAQIGTFGTMMARGSVRDVARALGFPYTTGDRLSKMIPMGSQGFPMTIERAMEMVPELKKAYDTEKETKQIIDLAKKMEGCVRHVSVHAAGVVIAPRPLTDFTPIQRDPKGEAIITQYDMHAVEDVGLPKFDFLGIRNLAILADAVRLVQEIRGITVDLEKIPLDDPKTFEMLARGETEGLFQLNGSGMTAYLKQLKPTTIFDINAMVALYRPGPMEMIPDYIKRKHNPRAVRFLDPRMKDILDQSYGVITYQDDVMMIAIKLGGYSWLEADKLRKAMGKKIPEEMAAQKEKLLEGFLANGMTEKKAQELWALIEPFAAYGFNKAHAASYGLVAYQTAYMKANFPVEYMTAILTAESGDTEKIAEIIHECTQMKIEVLPPSVNESFGGFTVIENAPRENKNGLPAQAGVIRFGLYTVKNLGTDISDAIIAERKENGLFKDIGNFLERIKHKNLNKKSVEALIKCGAMDMFGDRGTLLANMEDMLAYNRELGASGDKQQTSLFGDMPEIFSASFSLKPAQPASKQEMLAWEKELLGLYISGHPLDRLREKIEANGMNITKLKAECEKGAPVTFAGIIEEVKPIITKNNERMAFVRVADFTSTIECVIFPKVFSKFSNDIMVDKIIAIKGSVSDRNDEKSVLIDAVKVL